MQGILSQFGRGNLLNSADGDDDANEDDAEAAEEADESREAADEAILDGLDIEELGIDVTAEEIRLASGALSKVFTFQTLHYTLY